MENKKDVDDVSVEAYIKGITSPIFSKVLQETHSNHTMVVSKHKKAITKSLYNPHNYRLYFSFEKVNYQPLKGMVGPWFGKYINYGKEFTAVGEGIRVTVRKTQAEVINKLTEQEWFSINRSKAKEEIFDILTKIDAKCISSLKKFIEVYGGSTDFKILHREERPNLILNTKSDNKIIHEPYIDSLPPKMTFETSIVKKPYKELIVEFKEPIYAARYLENSALNEFAPDIVIQLKLQDERLSSFEERALNPLTKQIELHLEVQKETLHTLKEIRNSLHKKKDIFSSIGIRRCDISY